MKYQRYSQKSQGNDHDQIEISHVQRRKSYADRVVFLTISVIYVAWAGDDIWHVHDASKLRSHNNQVRLHIAI
jgi:hypothetical protein